MITKENKSIKIINASTCLLLEVSKADNHIDIKEIKIIKDIIIDFFKIEKLNIDTIISDCMLKIEKSTDIYQFGKILNENFTYQDKIDFICCTFEVAFIDSDAHYLEEHIIKKIAYILSVEDIDLIKAKKEMKKIFSL